MIDNFIPAITAALVTTVFLWLAMPLARRVGLVDLPGGRKDHSSPTPSIGGVAIAVGVAISAFMFGAPTQAFLSLMAAGALLLAVGTLDDLYDVRWYWRVLAQVVASLILYYWGGVRVDQIGFLTGDGPLLLGQWSLPFTILGTVGVINAINMCDGVDGLAGSICAIALMMLAAMALTVGNVTLFGQVVPIIAAVIGFLCFNLRSPWLRRAKVFLGNAGSGALGLTIAWAAFGLTQDAAHPVAPVLAPWLLAPPLIDCLVLMVRRIKLGRSPFTADREHLHHLLLSAGFSSTQVSLGVATLTFLLGLLAIATVKLGPGSHVLMVLVFGSLTLCYYWLTARRVRAVTAFIRLRMAVRPPRSVPATGTSDGTVPLAPLVSPDPAGMLFPTHRTSKHGHRSSFGQAGEGEPVQMRRRR